MASRALESGVLALTAALLSCGGTTAPGTPDPGRALSDADIARVCGQWCSQQTTCAPPVTLSLCLGQCTHDSESLKNTRADYLLNYGNCFAALPCPHFLDPYISDCQTAAREGLRPTAAAEGYCSALATKDASCGRATTPTATCLKAAALFADSAHAAAIACLKMACGADQSCVKSTFTLPPG